MNNISNWILVLIGLGVTSMVLANDETGNRSRPSFEDIDQNKDMLISSDEIEAFMQGRHENRRERSKGESQRPSRFEKADTDGDGYVNQSEFDALHDGSRRDRRGKPSGQRSHGCGEDSA